MRKVEQVDLNESKLVPPERYVKYTEQVAILNNNLDFIVF